MREHQELVFISQNGMVQRIAVRELRPLGRDAQGVRLMNVREDDVVSAVALVVESRDAATRSADDAPVSLDASGVADEPALDGDGVIIGDPDEEALLDVPEVESRRDARLRRRGVDGAGTTEGPGRHRGPRCTACWTTWPSPAGLCGRGDELRH